MVFLQKGKYYFVCGVGGHCLHGNQKVIFIIIVIIIIIIVIIIVIIFIIIIANYTEIKLFNFYPSLKIRSTIDEIMKQVEKTISVLDDY